MVGCWDWVRLNSSNLKTANSPRDDEKTLCRFELLVAGRSGDAQEDQNGTIQPNHILVSKAADTITDLCLRNGRDLICHQSADSAQAVALAWLDRQPKQRSIGWVGSECAHRGRIRHAETAVLKNHNGTGLARIVLTASNSPNLAALHIAPQSETALMKFCSSLA